MKVGDITNQKEYEKVNAEELDFKTKKVCPENWLKFSNAYDNFDPTED